MAKAKKKARVAKRTKVPKAEKVLRRMLQEKYPPIEGAIDELAKSGIYGENQTFLEAVIEIIREAVMARLAQKFSLLEETIARMSGTQTKQRAKEEKRK